MIAFQAFLVASQIWISDALDQGIIQGKEIVVQLQERAARNREFIYQLYLEGVRQGDLLVSYLDSLGLTDVAPVITQSAFFFA